MSALKRLFNRTTGRPEEDYSSYSSMVKSPPPGRVTARNDPNHEVWKPQTSKGDQTAEGRIPFFNSGFAVCPQCGERNVWRFEEKAGVHPNGDTYGTELFRCQTKACAWKTSFFYNDGAPGCKHYETTYWPTGIHCFPHSFMLMWADKHKLGDSVKHQFFTKKLTGNMLVEMDASTEKTSAGIREGLEVKRKEADKIRKALNKPMTAVLTRQATKK